MKAFFLSILVLFFINTIICEAQNTVTIAGKVTDFQGNPIDSSIVELLHPNFKTAYETYTDKKGNYKLNVEKGKYMAMYVIRPKEYPRQNQVSENNMRLEYWAWNIIADKDLVINPRYHRLEIYGSHVFETYGGYPGLFIYFRPMSLTKYLSYPKEIYLDKAKSEKIADISVKPENLKIQIYADEEPVKINSIQPIEEYHGENQKSMTAYLVQVDYPKSKIQKPYIVFRIIAENTEFGEKGENIFFYEREKFN
ncbi:MAG: carboxypeptidase-like regulatory domain-containing protein [Dysgonamonadaceae bacterium]